MAVTLSWREYGSGQPLVLLHGLFGSRNNWYILAKLLSTHFRVLIPDLRNHGDSPWAAEMNYLQMAEDVRIFLDAHVSGAVSILGHSMGGKVAMALALSHPRLCRRLLVLDIAPADYPDHFTPYIEAVSRLNIGELDNRQQANLRLKEYICSDAVRALLLQNLVRRGRIFEWRINFSSIADNLSFLTSFPQELLSHNCSSTALFIRGAESDYVSDQHRILIRRLFPQATFKTIPAAGHWLHIDQPALLAESILHWFNQDSDCQKEGGAEFAK
jgi:esterase